MKTIFTLSILFVFLNVHAQTLNKAGTPDYNFGDSGRTATRFYTDVVANCVTTQQDGKILAAGGNPSAHGWEIARYLNDGRLDSSFNHDGKMIGFIPGSKRKGDSYATGIVVQPDSKILVVGVACINIKQNNFDYDFAIARYLPDGSRDLAFGNGGYVTTDLGTISDKSLVIALQSDGEIIVAGTYAGDIASGNAVVRYTANGRLDSTFGKDGVLKYNLHYYEYNSTPVAIKSLPNGKILIAETDYSFGLFVLMRLNKNGSLDSSFGIKGGVSAARPPDFFILCHSMALQKDGKIILAGSTVALSNGIAGVVARFTKDGLLDSSFGHQGFIVESETNVPKEEFNGVCVQTDDKIVVAGSYFKSLETSDDFYVVRYTPNGKKDSSFGNNGTAVNVDFNKMGDGANAVALLPNGKIVVAGGTYLSYSNSSFGVVVYNNDEKKIKPIDVNNKINSLQNVSISPNPATNNLQIQGLSPNQKIKLTVVDFAGNIKLQAATYASSYNLNIASLKQGDYLLKIEMNNDIVTRQFMKE